MNQITHCAGGGIQQQPTALAEPGEAAQRVGRSQRDGLKASSWGLGVP